MYLRWIIKINVISEMKKSNRKVKEAKYYLYTTLNCLLIMLFATVPSVLEEIKKSFM